MNKEVKIFLTVLISAILLLFIIANLSEPSGPKEFVENKTFANYSNLFFSYEITKYPSKVEIMSLKNLNDTTIGFNTDPWNINVGIIPGNGTFVERTVELTNLRDKESKITFKAYGNISPLVIFSKNDFVLNPGKKIQISVFLFSNQTEPGNYSGEIDVIVKKPIYNFIPIS
jgi:hypothetical protein